MKRAECRSVHGPNSHADLFPLSLAYPFFVAVVVPLAALLVRALSENLVFFSSFRR